MKTIGHFISGNLVEGKSGRFGDVYNPSTGEVQAQVALATKSEVEDVIAVAQAAFPAWSGTSVVKRARILQKLVHILNERKDEMAKVLSSEHGKVFADAQGDVQRGLEVAEFAAGMPHLLKGEFSDNVATGIDVYSMRKPLGVVAGITPFNFPAMIPLWMSCVAIATGNTYVLKPSEKDPSVPLMLAQCWKDAGLPDGVFNVVNGDKEAVDTVCTDSRVKAVSFVGSTAIASYVYSTCAANGKRCQAMGGAKNHGIVMPDADLDMVVDAFIGSAYGSAGERCMALPVAVAVGGVGDALRDALIPRIKELKIGPSLAASSDIGPLVTKEHHAKVSGYLEMAKKEGATVVVDGADYTCHEQGYENGFFMAGTLLDNVTTDMQSYQDEIFGPVLQIVRVDDYDAAVALPSEHPYGNGTAIFTRDGDTARAFVNNVEVGMVGVNVPIPVPLAFHTFGGWKASAFGDINQHGMEGVRFYTKTKTVTSRWPSGAREGAEFNIPTLN